MAFKIRGHMKARRAKYSNLLEVAAIDEQFSNTGSLTKMSSGEKIPYVASDWTVGSAGTATPTINQASYPKAWFRFSKPVQTINAYGLGYGAGVVFWMTDSANWWAAVADADTSQSYDTYYTANYACGSQPCGAYYWTGNYGGPYYIYNYTRMTRQAKWYKVSNCDFYYCTSYYVSSYNTINTNYRYNGKIRIIRSIANSVSTVAQALWNQTKIDQLQVSLNNGAVTVRGYNGGVERMNTSSSGGSGNYIGIIGSPTTNSSYLNDIRITRIQAS